MLKLAENLSEWMKRPEVHHLAEDFSSFLLSSVKGCVPRNVSSTKDERKDVEFVPSTPLFHYMVVVLSMGIPTGI